MNIVFVSPPGSGKGTHSELLKEKYNLISISTGELIRKLAKEKNAFGSKIIKKMKSGELLDDYDVLDLLKNHLESLENNFNNGIIFDGFPRNINQAKLLEEYLLEVGISLDYILCLDIDKSLAKERIINRASCMSCHKTYNKNELENLICPNCRNDLIIREDDNETTFNERYDVYLEETKPILDFYTKKGYKVLTLKISKEQTINEIFSQIVNLLEANHD